MLLVGGSSKLCMYWAAAACLAPFLVPLLAWLPSQWLPPVRSLPHAALLLSSLPDALTALYGSLSPHVLPLYAYTAAAEVQVKIGPSEYDLQHFSIAAVVESASNCFAYELQHVRLQTMLEINAASTATVQKCTCME